jgi:hypothetical protein
MEVCPVCQTPLQAIWICTMSNCPEKIKVNSTEARKKYIDILQGWGKPEIQDDHHHEHFDAETKRIADEVNKR